MTNNIIKRESRLNKKASNHLFADAVQALISTTHIDRHALAEKVGTSYDMVNRILRGNLPSYSLFRNLIIFAAKRGEDRIMRDLVSGFVADMLETLVLDELAFGSVVFSVDLDMMYVAGMPPSMASPVFVPSIANPPAPPPAPSMKADEKPLFVPVPDDTCPSDATDHEANRLVKLEARISEMDATMEDIKGGMVAQSSKLDKLLALMS